MFHVEHFFEVQLHHYFFPTNDQLASSYKKKEEGASTLSPSS